MLKKIGLSKQSFEKIKKLNTISDRVEILTTAMNDGLIRIRNHKNSYTFEFTASTHDVLWSIYKFGKKIGLGDFSNIFVANLRTKENFETTWKDFVNKMDTDERSVLRLADKNLNFNYKVKQIADGIFKQIS